MLLVVSGCSMLKPHEVIKARGAGDAAQAIGTDCDAAATDLERWLNQLLEDGPVLFDVSPRPQAPGTSSILIVHARYAFYRPKE